MKKLTENQWIESKQKPAVCKEQVDKTKKKKTKS